jgi:quercetin dioxygenase-like cupin family protein
VTPSADTGQAGPVAFTGAVTGRLLRAADRESALAMYEVTFAAAARTHWHTHPRGQALFITAGRARLQIEGHWVTEHRAGEFVWIPPGTRHWHGAVPESPMTHLAVQEAGPDGSTVTWCEAVTDPTYAASTP